MITTIPAMIIATGMSRGARVTTIAGTVMSTVSLAMTTITPAMATGFSTVTPTATTTARTRVSAAYGGP